MKFSVIMASRLIPYPNCAKFLDQKIVRAIQSVIDQTFTDFELLVIADSCEETKRIVSTLFSDERLKLLECRHHSLFHGLPRNTGIDNAQGEYIIYLDIDDYYGPEHLSIIERNLNDSDWVWYNDYIKNPDWIERACNIRHLGGCGTSNVCYKRSLGIKWDRPGYAHDFYFIQKLLLKKGKKIETPEYFVCHIPGQYDV